MRYVAGRGRRGVKVLSRTALVVCLALVCQMLPLPRAAAAETQAIEGTVTTDSGPIAGVCVHALGVDGWGRATTSDDGTYRIEGLPVGVYRIQFEDCQTQTYAAQYHPGTLLWEDATEIAVTAGQTVTGIDALLVRGGTISGVVTDDAGTPVSACVSGSMGSIGVGAQTNATTGAYTLRGVIGDITIYFRPCAQDSFLTPEYYDDAPNWQDKTTISVGSDDAITGIDGALSLGGRIEGLVLDDDTLRPLEGICVDAVDAAAPEYAGFTATARTGAEGTFKLGPVPPGPYRIRFLDCGERVYASEWHQDAASIEASSIVDVAASSIASGIEATLGRGGTIAGTVRDEAGNPLEDVCVVPESLDPGLSGVVFSARTATDGTFRLAGLRTGDYRVRFAPCHDSSNPDLATQWYSDADTRDVATTVSVTAPEERAGIDAVMRVGGTVFGTVTDGTGGLAGMCVSAGDSTAVSGTDGAYAIRGVPAGSRIVQFNDCQAPLLHVGEYFDDAQDVDAATPVAVLAGEQTGPVDATIELGGTISGLVTSGGTPLSRACVGATAVTGGASGGAATSPDGRYTIGGLPAGDYRVGFYGPCSGDGGSMEWYDDVASEPDATPVTVRVGEDTPGIDADLEGLDGSPSAPSATLAVSPSSGGAPLVVNASVEASDTDGSELAVTIDWGDGSAAWESTIAAPYEPVDAEHTYTATGTYTVTMRVRDGAGNLVTRVANVAVGSVPAAPPAPSVEHVDGDVRVHWQAPADGGLPIESWIVRSDPAGVEVTVPGGSTSLMLTEDQLDRGVAYSFSVAAVNAAGEGLRSQPSAPIALASQSTTTVSGPATSEYGQAVTVTAQVTAVGASSAPTGAVDFRAGDTVLGSSQLVDGVATITVWTMPVGAQQIVATYQGSESVLPSSGELAHEVRPATPALVPYLPDSVTAGDDITGGVSVTTPDGRYGEGTLQVFAGNTLLQETEVTYGWAQIAVPAGSAGVRTLQFRYSGSETMAPASASDTVTVEAATVSVQVTLPERLMAGQRATGEVRVRDGRWAPVDGVVEIVDGPDVVQEVDLEGGRGVISFHPSSLGPRTVTARFRGAGHLPEAEASVMLDVVPVRGLAVDVVDPDGAPLPVTIVVLDAASGQVLGQSSAWSGSAQFPEIPAGTELDVRVTYHGAEPVVSERSVPAVATAGGEVLRIEMPGLPRAQLSGVVTVGGAPLVDADVLVYVDVGDRQLGSWSGTDEAGAFAVESVAGLASISIFHPDLPSGSLRRTATLAAGPNETRIDVGEIRTYAVHLDVTTQFAGGAATPVPVNSSTASTLDLSLARDGSYLGVVSSPTSVTAFAGDTLELCGDNRRSGLVRRCASVVLGDDLEPTIELALQQATSIVGVVALADAAALPSEGVIEVRRFGAAEVISSTRTFGGSFGVVLPDGETGDYEVTIVAPGYRTARSVGSITQPGEQLDIGTIALLRSPTLLSNPSLTSLRSAVVPGGTATMRATYEVAEDLVATQLVLPHPVGGRVVVGSVTVNGTPVAGVDDGAALSLDLGDRSAGSADTIQYLVAADPDVTAHLEVSARLRAGEVEELIGVAVVDSPQVTLHAPSSSVSRSITVSGSAPPGSTVTISDALGSLSTALVSPGGLWKQALQLRDAAPPARHVLTAAVEIDGHVVASEPAVVQFDPSAPELVNVAVYVGGRLQASFDPRDGVARYPSTFADPIRVELTFSDPDLVRDVQVAINSTSRVPAAREGDVYVAVIPATSRPGDIRVTWETDTPTYIPDPPTSLEDLRADLAPGFDGWDVASVTQNGDEALIELTHPDAPEGSSASIVASLEPATDFAPTEDELAEAAKIRGALVRPRVVEVNDSGDQLRVTVEGHIPAPAEAAYEWSKFTLEFTSAYLNDMLRNTSYSMYGAAAKGFGIGANFAFGAIETVHHQDRINALRAGLDRCPTAVAANLESEIDELSGKRLAADAVAYGAVPLAALVLFTGPVGWGTAAVSLGVFAIGQGIGRLYDSYERSVAENIAASGCGADGSTVASPVWMYDPSGYVYEGLTWRRIADVKSTVLYRETPESAPVVWNAEWFGQVNPQYTNEEGRYAWDVPIGFWQVAWEKEGYRTAYSEILEVLPPHFDVNVSLERLDPVDGVVITAGATDLRLELSLPVIVDSLLDRLTVKANGTPIPGTVVPLDAEDTPAGPVADTFIIQPDSMPASGTTVTATVAPGLLSYAGVPTIVSLTDEVVVAGAGGGGGGGGLPGGGGGGGGGSDGGTSGLESVVLAGTDRIATAILASRQAFPTAGSAPSVVLARADAFPDALAGVPLAADRGAPLLLSTSEQLPGDVLAEVERVLPSGGEVLVLGGTAALSEDVEATLVDAGFVVTRFAGADRYETAVAIARVGIVDPEALLVVSGETFADALAAGPAAAHAGGAIVLSSGASMPPATATYLAQTAGIEHFAVGGPAAEAAPSAEAVLGADRYATAVAVARRFFPAPTTLGVAAGRSFPDGMTGGALLATHGAPLLLVPPQAVPRPVFDYLTILRGDITHLFVLGGHEAISPAVTASIEDAVTAP